MSRPKEEAIKVRVPSVIKTAVKRIADGRFTTESEIVREAIIEYLNNRAAVAASIKPPGKLPTKTDLTTHPSPALNEALTHYDPFAAVPPSPGSPPNPPASAQTSTERSDAKSSPTQYPPVGPRRSRAARRKGKK